MVANTAGPAICPVCWKMVDTFVSERGTQVLYAHPRPATGHKRCPGGVQVGTGTAQPAAAREET